MKYFLILIVVFLTACQSESSAENPSKQAQAAAVSTNAVAVSIEGKALGIASIDGTGSKAKITADAISLALAEKGNPLSLNLEVQAAGILATGSASYTLPLARNNGMTVDLSFIDSTRPGIAMKQRVLFSEGSIEFKSVTANSLQMVFKGTGHALMDQKKFPVEGSVNITF
jgi:hypothetical protein